MGAGCSSPLRRFGAKRTKANQSDPGSVLDADLGENLNNDNLIINQNSINCQQQPTPSSSTATANALAQPITKNKQQNKSTSQQNKHTLDNENTDINDDHPSTASYNTDYKNNNLDNDSNNLGQKSLEARGNDRKTLLLNEKVASRIIGLNGGYMPHDRHLLVSPALSPAPSTCYSPSPATGAQNGAGSSVLKLNLRELDAAFKTLTLGLPFPLLAKEQQLNNTFKRIRHSEGQSLTELQTLYTQQLVSDLENLAKFVSVVFISADNFDITNSEQVNCIELLANQVESNLKSFCDESLFNLRFLNLSFSHLRRNFHINNLIEASIKILEHEIHENGQQLIIIILSNANNTSFSSLEDLASSDHSENQVNFDKRLLPTEIDSTTFNTILTSSKHHDDDQMNIAENLFKTWYSQIRGTHYLNPIYMVHPKILGELKSEREKAWQQWLADSNNMIKIITKLQDCNTEFSEPIRLKTSFDSLLEYIMQESSLHRRTLLIRSYSQMISGNSSTNHQQSQQPQSVRTSNESSIVGLTEFSRLLADPNKLNIKCNIEDEDSVKTINNWVCDNFGKFIESFIECQIVNGKQAPPFIDSNLFTELTRQRHHLESFLDNITENFYSKCHTFYTNQISPILNCLLNQSLSNDNDPIQKTDSSEKPISDCGSKVKSTNHLVFISGPKGCGKSSLFAQLIRLSAQDFSKNIQIIYRFCGITLDSVSPNRLLRSICEQFCQTQGENTAAASYVYSSRNDIMNSLNKILKHQYSLILLDGLDKFDQGQSINDLDWICDIESDLPIKFIIVLETDSDLYKKALSTYTDATYISLDNPSLSEWAQMLTSTARSKRFNSATSLYDEINSLDSKIDSNGLKLTYRDFSDIIHMCRIRKLNNEFIYPELSLKMIQNNSMENLKNIQQVIISHLHYIMTPYQLCSFFIILHSSRYGLRETDIVNIMNLISSKASKKQSEYNLTSTTGESTLVFSQTLLEYLKMQLDPWLIKIVCDNSVKITIHKDFLVGALHYYVPAMFKNIMTDTVEILIEYLSGQSKSKGHLLKGDGGASGIVELKNGTNQFNSIWLANQTSELNHLLTLSNPTKAREHILNKYQFFNNFLHSSAPEEFIEDCALLKESSTKKQSGVDEIQMLVNFIKQSIYPLRYDGCQIYSQIYCRAYESIKTAKSMKSKKLNDIINIASCPPRRNLLPISEASINSFIRTRIGLNQLATNSSSTQSLSSASIPSTATTTVSSQKIVKPTESSHQNNLIQLRQKIYTIRDNHRHVIVIYPDKGSVSVWDIFEEKAVRTISNLDQPRDLRMIDKKRAVILCNRELRVYDLDSGILLNKLKGVMNQKMPFFEVFEENYVIALARNRMYVNMLNLNTGELETTFKVGEDRFLNSLLVSANGGICVCGDETQKPFPLLVWNLNERRLMYDLRLDKHEFLTRMSAISDDGHFVVSVCRQLGDGETGHHAGNSIIGSSNKTTNFIVIYDLNSGTLFKKWKPGVDTCSVAISLSANKSGRVVNGIMNNTILIWDLTTGSKRHTLVGHIAPVDILKVQNNRVFSMDSSCQDQSLRIWDIDEGYCLAVFSPDAPVSSCQISIRGDALVCGFAAGTRLSTLVICKNETVNDVVKRNKRRKSSKSIYIFDEPPSRKASS